jgi:hypothetical protein
VTVHKKAKIVALVEAAKAMLQPPFKAEEERAFISQLNSYDYSLLDDNRDTSTYEHNTKGYVLYR